MASKRYVKLSSRASIFYDQASKIKVLRKDVVELTDKQFNLRVIKAALANGYLIEAKAEEFKAPGQKESSPAHKKEVDLEAVRKKFDELMEAEEAPEKIKEQFNTEELKALAISLEIEPEDGDTKLDLVNAILDELKDEDDE
jgi:hypothetical protein|nr:MAG TPA: hypothetical protein [Caudoviricetes sp.]